jgi:putative nucleotidyltransferase with HDIG domain
MAAIEFKKVTYPVLERLLFNMNSLADLGEVITSLKDFHKVVKSALYMVMGTFSSSKGAIFQYDQEKKAICPIVSKGLGNGCKDVTIVLSKDIVKGMVKQKKPMDVRSEPLLGAVRGPLEKFGARIIAPLVVKDELIGLISINEKLSDEDFTAYDFRLFSTMAHHIAVSLHNRSLLKKAMHRYNENKVLYENLRRIYYDTVHAFATAIDAKDDYTKGHSHRVSAYCTALAREMGLPSEEVEGMRVAGHLHDIGKIAIDKSIINKATPLTTNEKTELNSHPVVGYDILSKIRFPWRGIPRMIRYHHEKIDGSGYPDSLKREEIPVGARMMALVDAFDAMTTDRPYRSRLSLKEVMAEIKENLGKQFDPTITRSFLSVIYKEVKGEVEHPSVIPHIQERLDPKTVGRFLDDFPSVR